MADPHVVSTLRRKVAEIERVISAYERKLDQARRDLSAVNAALRLFTRGGGAVRVPGSCERLAAVPTWGDRDHLPDRARA